MGWLLLHGLVLMGWCAVMVPYLSRPSREPSRPLLSPRSLLLW